MWLAYPLLAAAPALAQEVPTDPGDLVITEFMAEPSVAAYYGEWFEIYNASGRNLNLDGLEVQGVAGEDAGFTITGTVTLAAGDYLVLGVDDDTSRNGNIPVDYVYDHSDFKLNDNEDTIELVYAGVTIDRVDWDSTDWSVQSGTAYQANLNASDLEWANDLPHNWCLSKSYITGSGEKGTPGTENEWCDGSNDDIDGDGYTEAMGDCDDTDPYVNPDAIDGDSDPFGVANDDADCDGVRDDGVTDDDGDGYAEVDGDCNDSNDAIHPGAHEDIDSIDNDCNGCVDDKDDDADGWTECDDGSWVYCGSDPTKDDDWCADNPNADGCVPAYDCDDADNFVYPCAAETPYDGADQDCDGWDLCDVDGDGWEAEECPDDAVHYPERERDCDDSNAEVNPGAQEEAPPDPQDGIDNDCNGVVDDNYIDADGDGWSVADGDCWDDPNDERAALVHPGAEEDCTDLLDNDCNGLYNDGCDSPAGYAVVQGGGGCAAAAPAGAASCLLSLLSLFLAGARRHRGGR